MVRNSLLKVGVTLPAERRRVSRQLLTEMNVTQLQVILNDLHSHIEGLFLFPWRWVNSLDCCHGNKVVEFI